MSHPPRCLENQSKQPCHERPRWVWIAKPLNGNYNHYDNFVLGAKKSGSMAHILRNAHWNGENFVPRVFFFFFISGNEWRFVCENKSKVSLLQTSTVLPAIHIAALFCCVTDLCRWRDKSDDIFTECLLRSLPAGLQMEGTTEETGGMWRTILNFC